MENWKEINGYEGYYEVSDAGRVRALTRTVPVKKKNGISMVAQREQILKQHANEKGYLCVRLHREDKFKRFKVHRLVAEAFIPGDATLTVNHKDGDKKNNHSKNLEWLTHQDNIAHAINVLGRKIGRGHKHIC